jgi:hypothetical protein
VYQKLKFQINSKGKSNTTYEGEYEEHIVYYTVDELQNITDVHLKKSNVISTEIWKPYLLKIFNGTSINLDFEKDIIMTTEYDLEVLLHIMSIVRNTTANNLELFMWMEVFEIFIPHTTTLLETAYDYYIRTVSGRGIGCSRSIGCSNTVSNMMGMAVGYKMIDKKSANQTLIKVYSLDVDTE